MKSGDVAWCAIGGYEAAALIRRLELLSTAFDRYRERFPILTHIAVIYVALHLLRHWPKPVDPLYQIATRLGR